MFLLTALLFLLLPQAVSAATLSLSPSTATFNRGCNYSVDVNLNTTSQDTDGADAILNFDKTKLNVTSISPGSIYPEYPVATPDNNNGTISISGYSSAETPFNGSGRFATINFLVTTNATLSQTPVTFDFDTNNKAKTTDSNVVQSVTVADILDNVTNGTYTIGNGSCGSSSGGDVVTDLDGDGDIDADDVAISNGGGGGSRGGGTSSATGSSSLDDLVGGPPGTLETTLLIGIIGGILVIIGIAGLALV